MVSRASVSISVPVPVSASTCRRVFTSTILSMALMTRCTSYLYRLRLPHRLRKITMPRPAVVVPLRKTASIREAADFERRLLRWRRVSIVLSVVRPRFAATGEPIVLVPRVFGLASILFKSHTLFAPCITSDSKRCFEPKSIRESILGLPFTRCTGEFPRHIRLSKWSGHKVVDTES